MTFRMLSRALAMSTLSLSAGVAVQRAVSAVSMAHSVAKAVQEPMPPEVARKIQRETWKRAAHSGKYR